MMTEDQLKKTNNESTEPISEESLPRKEGEEQDTGQLDELQKTAAGLKDQLLRKAAEFENYKRRTEAEFHSIVKNANERLLGSLLPIADDLARSLKSCTPETKTDPFYRGVELIHNKLLKTLESSGVVPFESVGKPFDVGHHDALMQVPRSDVPDRTVIEEVERGYMLYDRVLRHAKVVVSSAPNSDDTQDEETN